MSDEFDSLDASEKAAKQPSDDVVETAPVKCRYTQSGICANIAGFCLCSQRISICRAALTPEQEKAALDRLAGQLAHQRSSA